MRNSGGKHKRRRRYRLRRTTIARWEVDLHTVGAVTLYLLGGKDVANGLIMMGTALAAALGARITREK